MRIAILSDGVHPYVIGGMQRHTFYLCKYLSRNGVKITLVHFNRSNMEIDALEIFSEEEKKNIESIVIPFPAGDGWPGHYLRASHAYSTLIFERLKDRWSEFDFIYTKGFSAWKLIEEKQKSPASFPPISVKFHGYEMFQKQADFKSFLQSRLLRRPVRWISKHADYVFSYGGGITDIIRSLGVQNERIIEIPAGIESTWIRDTEPVVSNELVFTYLGRYERRKGIEELNQALKSVLKSRNDFSFRFIGPFSEEQKVLSDKFTYYGSVTDNTKLKEILDSSDILVCPSWSEGMPNVILEAMARGNTVIATKVGAVTVMLNDSNALLIEPGNVRQLETAINSALDMNRETIQAMKRKALETIKQNFRYEQIVATVIQTIQSIRKTK